MLVAVVGRVVVLVIDAVDEGLLAPAVLTDVGTQRAHGLEECSRRWISRSAGVKGGGIEKDREDTLGGDDRGVDHEERRELGRQGDIRFGWRAQRDAAFGGRHDLLPLAARRAPTFLAARAEDDRGDFGGASFSFWRYDSPSMSTVTRCCVKRSMSGTRLAAP